MILMPKSRINLAKTNVFPYPLTQATMLLNLPKKKQELVSMSEKGKLIAKENYALEQYVKKLKNIYEIVINESNW